MRAVLKLEAIGDNYFAYRRFRERINPQMERHVWQMTKRGMRPWVARITGFDSRFGYHREFIDGVRDYTQSTSTGARGIFIYYALRPGLYEVNERISWHRSRRYFCRIEDTDIQEVSENEVLECLRNAT